MKRWHYFIIFVIGLLVRLGVGLLQKSPGFMDAEYYFLGGINLVEGNGFFEYILWNFLDDPGGIPHPSHGYWMPMASILAAFGMFVTQSQRFEAAQFVFILVGSLLPPLTAYLCFLLTNNRPSAFLAGGLAILSGFYLPFMTTSDTFGIYAVLGTLFFVILSEPLVSRRFLAPIAIGLVAGLMHFSRTDGLIWLGLAFLGILATNSFRWRPGIRKSSAILEGFILVIIGYLTIMGPWFIRNYLEFGSPLAPGGSRSLWIINYNELFIYPANQLTMEHWLTSGLEAILEARSWALGINLQRSITEQGLIFLSPLIIIGLWYSRKDNRIQLAILAWLSTFMIMTFVFPYQGARGGFFHSSAALLSILWTAATIGFNAILEWLNRVRNWNIREARIVFTIAILCFAFLITIYSSWIKFTYNGQAPSQWESNQITYQQVEEAITDFGAFPQEIVLTINPPGYSVATSRRAIAIPDGDILTTLDVAEKYGARFLVLGKDHPNGLDDLYNNPQIRVDRLKYIISVSDTHLFIIE
ncbi:hypothetical protein ACFLXI_05440 [Chloroflexota bacterium]